MSGGLQVPERYLLPEGSGALVPARIASVIYSRTDLAKLRVDLRGIDPELDAVLMALHISALKYRASADGNEARKPAEVRPKSSWVEVAEAAAELDLTTSRVRQELRAGHLKGEKKQGRGWRISRVELETYKAARAA